MGFRLKLLVGLAILAFLLNRIDISAAVAALADMAPGPAAAAAALFLLTHAINASKLGVLMPERRVGTLFAYTLVAQAYALLLPGQVAGEAVKAYRLGRGQGPEGEGQAASSVVFDKVTGIASVLMLTLLAIANEPGHFGAALTWAAAAGLIGVGLLVAALSHAPLTRQLSTVLDSRSGWRGWIGVRLAHFLDTWRQHAKPKTLALSVTYGIAAQAAAVVGSGMLGSALGIDISLPLWCVVIGALTVVLLAPLTIGGLGLREASLVGLLGILGVAPDRALALALAILAFQVMIAVLGLVADLFILRNQ